MLVVWRWELGVLPATIAFQKYVDLPQTAQARISTPSGKEGVSFICGIFWLHSARFVGHMVRR